MHERFCLNLDWYFKPSYEENDVRAVALDQFEKVELPHTGKELSYNCFSHDETAMVCSYARKLTVPEPYKGKRAVLEFLGVMARCVLSVNGVFVTEHRGGYSRFRVDITDYLHDGENDLFLMVDSTENKDIPPFGHTIDYMCFGGVYRDVNILFTEKVYIENILFRYDLDGTTATIYPEVQMNNAGEAFVGDITVELVDAAGQVVKTYRAKADFPVFVDVLIDGALPSEAFTCGISMILISIPQRLPSAVMARWRMPIPSALASVPSTAALRASI